MSAAVQQKSPVELIIILHIIQRLTKTPKSSSDAIAMHDTILSITAQHFSTSLQLIKQRVPKKAPEADGILSQLAPYLSYRRGPLRQDHETQQWIVTQGGLSQAFRYSFHSLCNWSANIAMNPAQRIGREYSSRLALLTCKVVGSRATLKVILEELKNQSMFEDGTAPLHLDVAVAIVCADELFRPERACYETSDSMPQASNTGDEQNHANRVDVTSFQRLTTGQDQDGAQLTIMGSLRNALEAAPDLIRDDLVTVEVIVRLHRRVTNIFASAAVAENGAAGVDTQNLLSNEVINSAAASLLPALDSNNADQPLDLSNLDLTGVATGNGLNLSLDSNSMVSDEMQGILGGDQSNVLSGLDVNGIENNTAGALGNDETDIFADLGLDADIDLGF